MQEATRLVDLAQDKDWERDSPCAGWSLRRLVAHMTAQHHGFAAAARGAGQEPAHWRESENPSEPAALHRAAAASVLEAFAEPGVTGREFALPPLGGDYPGRMAVGFHFIDYVIHAWDVAVALGVDVELPDEVLQAAVGVARLVPRDADYRKPGSFFAPALEVPAGAGPLQEALLLLGRVPERWSSQVF
ncbi:TIGR03086 family metal-binding protein [Streptomyces sp. TG1A-8]|uniref:TIGR03086 family metal-binding protein n=1 Tax=Streptomyces sp. TG1A-8 TaxID=3051385 RepID=UPI00265BD4C5|nr:TIGR03086 family metal-binding protein [Streptomyces sp. TG1A-8]MDO0929469.1 TIGR03086 family metal-binding protein [Streptomyces sp. TG1A-8]